MIRVLSILLAVAFSVQGQFESFDNFDDEFDMNGEFEKARSSGKPTYQRHYHRNIPGGEEEARTVVHNTPNGYAWSSSYARYQGSGGGKISTYTTGDGVDSPQTHTVSIQTSSDKISEEDSRRMRENARQQQEEATKSHQKAMESHQKQLKNAMDMQQRALQQAQQMQQAIAQGPFVIPGHSH